MDLHGYIFDLLYFLCSEYYYDIDFIDCAGQEEIQKRNKLLYESYCHLVSIIYHDYMQFNGNNAGYTYTVQYHDHMKPI